MRTAKIKKLPLTWVTAKLGELVHPIENVQPRNRPGDPFTYLDISSIDRSTNRVVSPKTYQGKDAPSRARQLVFAGDILFSTVRTYLRNVALVEASFDGCVASTGFCVIRPRECIDSKYVFYLTLSDDFLRPLSATQRGTSYPAVRNSDVLRQAIPLAPLNEQRRIVAKIEELFTKLDAGVEALRKVQALLKRYRQSVLKAAVEGKLTEQWRKENAGRIEPASELLKRILAERRARWEADTLATLKAKGKTPGDDRWKKKYREPEGPNPSALPELPQGWVWTRIEQLGVVTGGLTKNSQRKRFSLRLPYLRVANVYANELRLGEMKTIGLEESELERVLLRPRDMLIVEGNGSPGQIGRVALWDGSVDPCVHQNHLIKVRFYSTDPEFYLLYLLSSAGRRQITRVASSTSGLYTLSISKVSDLVVPLPSREEQSVIARQVDTLLSIADEATRELERELLRSNRLSQTILRDAFQGNLVAQHPGDEPASDLLKRIRMNGLKPQNQGSR